MADFYGHWQLISTDANFSQYMVAAGVSPERQEQARERIIGSKVIHDISRDGSTWIIKVICGDDEKVDRYPEGKETETTTLDGRKVKVVYTVEGGKLVETQTGEGFVSRNVREIHGDKMTMSFTANGSITSERVYKRLSTS